MPELPEPETRIVSLTSAVLFLADGASQCQKVEELDDIKMTQPESYSRSGEKKHPKSIIVKYFTQQEE